MLINLLAVGDVVATAGLNCLKTLLPKLKQEKKIDFCVVNGENTAILGLLPRQAEEIFDAGADVITMGNHLGEARAGPLYAHKGHPATRQSAAPAAGHGLGRL